MKRFFFLSTTILFLCIQQMYAYSFIVDGIYYNIISSTDKTVKVTYKDGKYNSYSGALTIPSTVSNNGNTYSVTTIGSCAFKGCTGLTSVDIPNSVTTIESTAFDGCTGLTSIDIPNSVTTIGSSAFDGCTGLTSVDIPNSVTTIEIYAFRRCTGLTSIDIPNSVTTIESDAFSGCTGLTSVDIPNSVTTIENYAFYNCTNLTSVYINDLTAWCNITFESAAANPLSLAHHLLLNEEEITNLVIPNDCNNINDYAFNGCEGLTEVIIPEGVTFIGTQAFQNCSNLVLMSIPNSLSDAGHDIIDGCNKLKYFFSHLTHPFSNSYYYGKNEWGGQNHGYHFRAPKASLIVPEGVSYVLWSSEFKATYTTSPIDFSDPLTKEICLENWDMDHDGVLGTFEASQVQDIGTTFQNTSITSFDELRYFDGLTSLVNKAFQNCTNLKSVYIPKNCSNIFNSVFWYCPSLKTIVVDEENTKFDSRDKCNAIIETSTNNIQCGCTGTWLPNTIVSAAIWAFYGSGLVSIDIPEGMAGLSNGLFGDCRSMRYIELPNSTTSMGTNCFRNCNNLSVFESYMLNPFNVTAEQLKGISTNCALYVPDGTRDAYIAAGWTEDIFTGGIYEAVPITIGSAGFATYCGKQDLDFSTVENLKAYIISGFDPINNKLILTRVTDVPAGTGLIVKGEPGTYAIPRSNSYMILSNMLQGVTTHTILQTVDGEKTNFVMTTRDGKPLFVRIEDQSTLPSKKAYLPLPTSALNIESETKGIGVRFDDEEATSVEEVTPSIIPSQKEVFYNLQGQRIENPTHGVYIINGKKVYIK